MNELLERVRRIETKLTRFIAGEPDKPHYKIEAWDNDGVCEIEVDSMSVSLQAVVDAARSAGCEEFVVCDNGKPRLSVRDIRKEMK